MKGNKGFALVITLVVTALLVALLVEFVNEVYVDTSHSHNFVASQQASILAESGIAGGVKLLQASAFLRQGGKYSSLLELWAKPQSFDSGDGTVTISIEEESGKLDLNSATTPNDTLGETYYQKVFARLMTKLELPQELYDTLADWADNNVTPRTSGAETSYYAALKPPYRSHDDRLDTVEELALVKGYTPEVLTKLRSSVTVYGSGLAAGVQTAAININTAPKELLAALDDKLMSGDLVDRILEYRKTKVIKTLADVSGLESFIQLQGKVVFQGTVYRIHAEGKVGDSVSVAEAVVSNTDLGKPTVLYWREY
jgi:general secretion pathway protein K